MFRLYSASIYLLSIIAHNIDMIIYKITNKINGKIYIGQTARSLEIRWRQHINCANKGAKTHLYAAIRKYGKENFIPEIICEVDNKDDLNLLETYYIKKYNSIKTGYNMVDGGNNNVMFIPSVKRKHSERLATKEIRQRISEGMKKYRAEHLFTEEHRRKLSEKAKGNHNFGSGDTRSIACYCILEDGSKHIFHSYRDAWKWWKSVDNPFDTDTECVYQRKIKQSIDFGYYTYKKQGIQYIYPKWYRESEVMPNEKVD